MRTRERRLRALILWSNPGSTNLGVRALAAGTAALVQQALGADVQIASQGYGPGDAPVGIGAARRTARRLVSRRDQLVDWLRGFDLVVDTRAGDSFSDIYGMSRHLAMTLVHEAVGRARVPVVLGPQTIGPFQTWRGRALAVRTVRSTRLVLARDPESLAVAQRLRARRSLLTTDVVFALPPPAPATARHDVLLNVSGLLWEPNDHVDHLAYRSTVRGLVAELTSRGRDVALLAHVLDSSLVDNDVPVTVALAQELGMAAVVPDGLDDARSVMLGAELVIGSRMHACLNALSVGTPAVPLAYSRKFAPLLDALGWPGTVDLRTAADPVAGVLRAASSSDLHRRVVDVQLRARTEIDRAADALADVV